MAMAQSWEVVVMDTAGGFPATKQRTYAEGSAFVLPLAACGQFDRGR